MVNQQKHMQQENAYSAVVVNGIPVPAYICFNDPFSVKNNIGTGIHVIYNCTIGSFLLHSFLMIYHPYPPSFHEMILYFFLS